MGILYDEKQKIFSIQLANASYFLKVDNEGILRILYWGKKQKNLRMYFWKCLFVILWYGTLHWSGNFKIEFEHTYTNQVCVTAVVNDFDCEIVLKQGQSYESPWFIQGT